MMHLPTCHLFGRAGPHIVRPEPAVHHRHCLATGRRVRPGLLARGHHRVLLCGGVQRCGVRPRCVPAREFRGVWHRGLAVGETVILAHIPLPWAGVSVGMGRGLTANWQSRRRLPRSAPPSPSCMNNTKERRAKVSNFRSPQWPVPGGGARVNWPGSDLCM